MRTLLAFIGVAFAESSFSVCATRRRKRAPARRSFSFSTEQGKKIPRLHSRQSAGIELLATWCPTCIEEIPSLDAFQKRFAKDGVVVVAVSVDKNKQK